MFQKLSKTTFSSGKLWVRLALLAVLLTFVATLALFLASAKQATFFQLSKPEDKQASKPDDKKEEDCSCEAKAPPDVVAIVNGVSIAKRDIDEPTKERVLNLQRQVIEARNRALDLLINSKVMEAEAKKRGISVVKLIDEEVKSKVKEPTEAGAQAFYGQNKGRIQADFKERQDDIIDYLRTQRVREEVKEVNKYAHQLRAAAEVKILVEKITPPKSESDRAHVLASVNGESITLGDVEDALRPLVFNVQKEVYDLRKRELDLIINGMLLEQEAYKRKITSRSLLEAEVTSKVKKITEEDARALYEQNKEKAGTDYAHSRDRIIQYLQDREQQNAEEAFAGRLRQAASIQVFLTPPDPPVYAIATDDQPSKGRQDAPVTIIEFTDHECPGCAQAQPIIEKLMKEYDGRMRLVVRDFPLEQHENAFKAAEAAEAAREQGKYWEYVALLLPNRSALGVDKLKEYASQIGLDRKKFDAALDSGKFADKVQRDLRDGWRLGINSTPTVFVNGQRIGEMNYESLKVAIEAALKEEAKKE